MEATIERVSNGFIVRVSTDIYDKEFPYSEIFAVNEAHKLDELFIEKVLPILTGKAGIKGGRVEFPWGKKNDNE